MAKSQKISKSHPIEVKSWAVGTRSGSGTELILLMSWLQKYHFQLCAIFKVEIVEC